MYNFKKYAKITKIKIKNKKMENENYLKCLQDSSIESSISNSPEIKKKVIDEIKSNILKIEWKNIDINTYYKRIFSWEFDENNIWMLLRLFSYTFIKANKLNLSEYIEKKWLIHSKEEIFRIFEANQQYDPKNTTKNLEVFHFLIRQIEISRLINQLWVLNTSQNDIWELKDEIKNKPIPPEIKLDSKQIKPELPKDLNIDTSLLIQLPQIKISPEEQKIKDWISQEILELNQKIKDKLLKDFWISEDKISTLYKKLWIWEYTDTFQANASVYASQYISRNKINLNDYLLSLPIAKGIKSKEELDELKSKLYEKFQPSSFSPYKWNTWQNLTIFYWLIIEKEFKNFSWLKDFETKEKTDDMLRFVDIRKVRSSPYEESKFWTTLCSRTAAKNLRILWVTIDWEKASIPRWDAKKLMAKLRENWQWVVFTNPEELKSYLLEKWVDGNVFDIYANTKRWHRAIFLLWVWVDGKEDIFVLDPYYSWVSRKPKGFDKYMEDNFWKNFTIMLVSSQAYSASEKYLK